MVQTEGKGKGKGKRKRELNSRKEVLQTFRAGQSGEWLDVSRDAMRGKRLLPIL